MSKSCQDERSAESMAVSTGHSEDYSTEHAGDAAQEQDDLLLESQLFSCASCGSHTGEGNTSKASTSLRLLSCLHSVCRSCLISCCARGDGTAICPTCMEVTRLPEFGWVDAMPRTYWSLGRCDSEIQAEKRRTPALECGECGESEPGEGVIGGCLDCNELLCSLHWRAHAKSRKTMDHRMSKDVRDFQSPGEPHSKSKLSRVPCSVHPDHDVTGFCSTCTQLVCDMCLERSHRQHAVDQEFLEAQEKKQGLADNLEKSNGGEEACEASIAEINATIAEVNEEAEKASKKVVDSVERLVEDLKKAEKATLHKIDEARWSLQKDLEKKLERKKTAKDQLKRSRFLAKEALDGKINNAQLFDVSSMLHRNINDANTECHAEVDLADLPTPRSLHKPCQTLVSNIRSFQSKVRDKSFLGLAEPANDQCPWQLQEDDSDEPATHHNPWRHVELASDHADSEPADRLSAMIESPCGEFEPCKIYACNCSNDEENEEPKAANKHGHVDLDFHVKEPGKHKLHVTYDGRHVRDSPCEIQVKGYPFCDKVARQPNHGDGSSRHLTSASAMLPNSVISNKWGLYIPGVPPSSEMKRSCRIGIRLYGKKPASADEAILLSTYFWQADGVFGAETADDHRPEVDGCTQAWEDDEVMQMEFFYEAGKWKLKLTYLSSGESSTATILHEGSISYIKALATYSNGMPVYLLPAFY